MNTAGKCIRDSQRRTSLAGASRNYLLPVTSVLTLAAIPNLQVTTQLETTVCPGGNAIASKLTEIILLGCVALRVGTGKAMEWDGKHMKSPNCPEAAQFVKRHNREGWKA